ncbi:hypothetical protein PH5382_00942 [Phaeobacter sp. CECT 5382]|uniref:DUF4159 domain-containing protein n=1 Tax=Phaeobacter sp. CECT 5382 TaxID=1712645 RepID=UPI0006DA1BA2|nr:DUF4159 domain-containing protein [Phaeobacter sp. CECT 5382]CUH87022.1 hypothetical protein PH5382_00942 [Phaeobacter sp. CECT 5382]
MIELAGIGFASPWLLLGLLLLPLLWILLRAVPPAPKRQVFPAVTLLLGLSDSDSQSDRTPWWLLLLRCIAVAAAIIGFAGPVLNPDKTSSASGPLLVVLDASWAGAQNWQATQEQISMRLDEAAAANRRVALLQLSRPTEIQFLAATAWQQQLPGVMPMPWQPGPQQIRSSLDQLGKIPGDFDTLWVSDGLSYEGQESLTQALVARGAVTVLSSGLPVYGLLPARYVDGVLDLTVLRSQLATGVQTDSVTLLARGRDPNGTQRNLAQITATFAPQAVQAVARLSLPAELRARIDRFEIAGQRSAGAVGLSDDSLRRREVALISSGAADEGLALLSPLHYLRKALAPSADLLEGSLGDLLPANPDVIILADVARLSPDLETNLTDWVQDGGLLVRFAGPRLAASDTARDTEEPLMPVRLRIGGRSIGGAMSWGEPKTLAPFAEGSPFFGLGIPEEVSVASQVVAQPDPQLADRVIAALDDGTPLVTRKPLGQGQVVLFHVTANAEWSSLPLSGLFVQMLERLAVSSATKPPEARSLEGTSWQPISVLDGFGRSTEAATLPGVAGPDLVTAQVGPALQPGLYASEDRRLARSVLRAGDSLSVASWGSGVSLTGYSAVREQPLTGALLGLALALLALDIIATLLITGQLVPPRPVAMIATLGLGLAFALSTPRPLLAQNSSPPPQTETVTETQSPAEHVDRAAELTLAHVLTGDARVDRVALAGLRGLSDTLFFRTSVEPSNPVSLDLERDDLALYPLLYWPVTARQPLPSPAAYDRLNGYLSSGGMILFDTRDADLASTGATSAAARRLQQLALPLDIPPLEPVPGDHVLTRAFYLLQDFPGRHPRGPLWVEAAPADAQQIEGIPFRDLNDGVTPVVIGGNDWASAWAVDRDGRPLLPVGRGYSGERQRELAYRFGVNLVMHVLTGNYKSDQVHVPALLERLGQ